MNHPTEPKEPEIISPGECRELQSLMRKYVQALRERGYVSLSKDFTVAQMHVDDTVQSIQDGRFDL